MFKKNILMVGLVVFIGISIIGSITHPKDGFFSIQLFPGFSA
jgi:hypothetical protein